MHPTRPTISTLILALVLSCASAVASAHQINPLANKYRQHPAPTVWHQITEPVHEDVTQIARACAANASDSVEIPIVCPPDTVPASLPEGNKYDSLVRGVWWNDDPNQYLFAGWQAKWLIWMEDAESIAKNGVNLRRRKAVIDRSYVMTYRSHYGDLQFLHAMASLEGESAEVTRDNVLDWAEFAYAVATGRIDPQSTFETVDLAFVRRHFDHRPGWSVAYLFAPKYRLRREAHYRDMALGALLHTVQDSYSDPHAARRFDASPDCARGGVARFHFYGGQDSKKHKRADTLAAFKARQDEAFTDSQNPVNVSATLIRYATNDVGWPVVRDYLETTVFCIDRDAPGADAGDPYASDGASPR
jgi:hypothetical protein